MENLKISEDFTEDDFQELNRHIFEFNQKNIPNINYDRICLFVKDEQGVVKGGLIALCYWDCVFLDVLWVEETLRHQKLGGRLVKRFEELVKTKGLNLIHLDTFDFQAQKFYKKMGYEVFAVLDDCPKGHKRYYMKKKIMWQQ